ncbi:hypothetical protein [Aurantiacibacter luteus]|uniref:Peptidase S1 n=1 Tax=Aurantiacibacter luteus TaxID=1581420 RepID=A0A0G9MXM1_9SPHN|nr:hypothetical protein [Aurantiacibacter luteus]KLE35537.1 hypothetical protein AAW00_03680 [Aurantiacibacter luteus]
MYKKTLLAAVAMSALGLSAPAMAQDYSAEPNYGTFSIQPGFADDPRVINVQSGGSVDASGISSDCAGYISDAPDVRLNYGQGSGTLPLIIGAMADSDTTLVINAPDGSWYCDDDRGADLNPLIRFHQPQAGQYDIWVGTYGGSDLHPARLYITELESTLADDQGGSSSGGGSSGGGGTNYGSVSLQSGFTPDPYLVRVQAGGSMSASNMASGCAGYVSSAADFELDYTSGSLPLYISADAMADTTLVVRAPNGSYYCDDDSGEGNNPRVWLQTPMTGRYQIWVGTFSSGSLQAAELNISELYSE